jgi:hypothetical protein
MSTRPLPGQTFRCTFRIPNACAGVSDLPTVSRATWTRAAHPTIIAVELRFQVDG